MPFTWDFGGCCERLPARKTDGGVLIIASQKLPTDPWACKVWACCHRHASERHLNRKQTGFSGMAKLGSLSSNSGPAVTSLSRTCSWTRPRWSTFCWKQSSCARWRLSCCPSPYVEPRVLGAPVATSPSQIIHRFHEEFHTFLDCKHTVAFLSWSLFPQENVADGISRFGLNPSG